jgi:membrane-associated phospholipid phosphatase
MPTTPAASPLPADAGPAPALAARRPRWRAWLVLWALVLAAEIALLANNAALDTLLWRTTRWFTGDQNAYLWADYKAAHAGDPHAPFYMTKNPPLTKVNAAGRPEARVYKRSETFWRLSRDLGEPVTTALVLALVWIYDRRRNRAAVMLLASTVGTGVVSTLVRITMGRFRPIVTDGDNRWQLFRGFHEGSNLSWPSGHSTLAFATAATLCYLSPRGRWLFLWIAACCALARVVMQAHYYSDIVLGSAIGWTLGWAITAWVDGKGAPGGTPEPAHVQGTARDAE